MLHLNFKQSKEYAFDAKRIFFFSICMHIFTFEETFAQTVPINNKKKNDESQIKIKKIEVNMRKSK